MKVIKPQPIVDANLFSSSVPETDYAVWSAATTYALGDRVIRTGTHRIYESLVSSNLNQIPENTTIVSLPSAPKWLDVSATNRWKMFDSMVNSQTEASTSLTVVVTPQNANSIGLFEVEGTSVNVQVELPSTLVVYNKTISLEDSSATDWYEYFFTPFQQVTQVVLTDLPAYYSAQIRVTFTGSAIKCGHLATGFSYDLGEIQYGASAGITDYSKKETDVYGNTTFMQRAYANRMSAKMWFDNSGLNNVHRILASLRATPCVWVGTDDAAYGPLVVYGWYKDFSIEVTYATTSYCTLEVEGLT